MNIEMNEKGKENQEGIMLGELLKMTESDDYFYINIRTKECLYLGYAHEVPDELKLCIIKRVYIDWASQCLGIEVFEMDSK